MGTEAPLSKTTVTGVPLTFASVFEILSEQNRTVLVSDLGVRTGEPLFISLNHRLPELDPLEA